MAKTIRVLSCALEFPGKFLIPPVDAMTTGWVRNEVTMFDCPHLRMPGPSYMILAYYNAALF